MPATSLREDKSELQQAQLNLVNAERRYIEEHQWQWGISFTDAMKTGLENEERKIAMTLNSSSQV